MAEKDDPFIVVPVQQIPAEKHKRPQKEIDAQLDFIKEQIVPKQNNELIFDQKAMKLLLDLGSDQIIITYGFNLKDKNGILNQDPDIANRFNHAIFDKLSVKPDAESVNKTPLIITTSEFEHEVYGPDFVKTYMKRLGLKNTDPITMNFISSTTMCPWLTATEEGNFIPHLIKAFRKSIIEVLNYYYQHDQFEYETKLKNT